MNSDIELALAKDELVFYYQPKISLTSGKVSGAEALIRWIQADGTVKLPNSFIPAAEASGFIKDISLVMCKNLMADLVIIQDLLPEFVMSFNLTAQDFESTALVNCVLDNIANYQLNPKFLQVELTETSLIKGTESVRENVQRLVDAGVSLAMDDFGTGYASIDTLSQWPFSVVKIDQGLIKRMLTSGKSTTIVEASICMAHQLGAKVVAEGVESSQLYEFLLRTGCTDAQGFWLGKPMPLSDLIPFLELDQRWSGMPIGLIHMAQLDHIHWRRSLVAQAMSAAFVAPETTAVIAVTAELNPKKCKLGEWYYGHGQRFRGHAVFDALEKPHQELHEIAQQLVEAVQNEPDREKITTLLRQLTQKSGEVLAILQELENEAILEHGGFIESSFENFATQN
ncbi:MAG: EAL domain-containing protein [Gammaproteobacteria bacterium]|nr:EAL domain-containing protein [Gammaproteobacteria bacterium]